MKRQPSIAGRRLGADDAAAALRVRAICDSCRSLLLLRLLLPLLFCQLMELLSSLAGRLAGHLLLIACQWPLLLLLLLLLLGLTPKTAALLLPTLHILGSRTLALLAIISRLPELLL